MIRERGGGLVEHSTQTLRKPMESVPASPFWVILSGFRSYQVIIRRLASPSGTDHLRSARITPNAPWPTHSRWAHHIQVVERKLHTNPLRHEIVAA